MGNTYWDNNGKYQEAYDTLWSKLVPASGACTTFEGELLRASGRMYYDLYNNGFGNNWSGAWNFINQWTNLFGQDVAVKNALNRISEFKCGGVVYGNETPYYEAVEVIVDEVLRFILERGGNYTNQMVDMFSLQEPDEPWHDTKHDAWGYEEEPY